MMDISSMAKYWKCFTIVIFWCVVVRHKIRRELVDQFDVSILIEDDALDGDIPGWLAKGLELLARIHKAVEDVPNLGLTESLFVLVSDDELVLHFYVVYLIVKLF